MDQNVKRCPKTGRIIGQAQPRTDAQNAAMAEDRAGSDSRKGAIARRTFIAGSAVAVASFSMTACGGKTLTGKPLPTPTETQRSRKKQTPSTVALVPCASYEDDPMPELKKYAKLLNLPDLAGKTVLLKPNMVEFHPGSPVTTNPFALKAAFELFDYLGAKDIIIGEGPGHMRDTEFLLEATGLGKMCKQLGVQFVDLNLDELEVLELKEGFSGLKQMFLPRTLMNADVVVSVPKMKTHHWVGMTASMKNFFGAVPGRKYGWPKNLLHMRGIPQCILDLQDLIKPRFALVDAVVAMEGDGPINGKAKEMGFFVLGDDLAAIDATCARTMGFDPVELDYIKIAGEVVGNISPESVSVIGLELDKVKKTFERPVTFKNKKLLAESANQAS
ncbi:MAG TPA: DUF362 domain-containing protein [Candidatus Obscuribacterales bacterium]|nr:DUF362 domain-containing protein [Candidatus Obscuribacterales bacterium]